ncbi:MAG: hypothetical protein ACI9R8_000281 [Candidatus Paceibacteria bacterium]|jgi:hypothetical protein
MRVISILQNRGVTKARIQLHHDFRSNQSEREQFKEGETLLWPQYVIGRTVCVETMDSLNENISPIFVGFLIGLMIFKHLNLNYRLAMRREHSL